MPLALAAGTFGTRCTVKECRAADLARQLLPLPQRETHTVWRTVGHGFTRFSAHLVARGDVPTQGALWARGRTRVPGQRYRCCTRRGRTIAASPPYPRCTVGPVRWASA